MYERAESDTAAVSEEDLTDARACEVESENAGASSTSAPDL